MSWRDFMEALDAGAYDTDIRDLLRTQAKTEAILDVLLEGLPLPEATRAEALMVVEAKRRAMPEPTRQRDARNIADLGGGNPFGPTGLPDT